MIYQTYGPTGTVGAYLGHARHLTEAAASLNRQRFGIAANMLLGHAIEVALKAWLHGQALRRGESAEKSKSKLAKSPLGHDLPTLWDAAVGEGLTIPSSRPIWFEFIAQMHGAPFLVRYPANDVAFPVPEDEVCSQILNLIEIIGTALELKWKPAT